jgi:peptidoglycan/xylan/chitin deacetylase (PgdA/CDA1 family)
MVTGLLLVGCGHESPNDFLAETDEQLVVDEDQTEWTKKENEKQGLKEAELETNGTEKSEPLYKIDDKTWTVVPIEEANEKVVLLTIDDAPDKYALEMAYTLKNLGAKAIFFVNGHFIDTQEKAAILKKIYDLGFPIGNHTYSHQNLANLTPEKQLQEIIAVNDLVEEITGERPKFFRAPFGANTDESKKIAADEKMVVMNWTYGYDWEKGFQEKDALREIMINSPYLNNGANLLMHDRKWTSEALEGIVQGLRKKGYEIVAPNLIKVPE